MWLALTLMYFHALDGVFLFVFLTQTKNLMFLYDESGTFSLTNICHELVVSDPMNFFFFLCSKLKAPLQPKVTIQIACSSSKDDMPHPIPILAVHVSEDKERRILLTHGTFLRPTFEKVVRRRSDIITLLDCAVC